MFKTKEGKVIRYEWYSNNEQKILKLCNEYAGFNKTSAEEMLLEVSFYKDNSIQI